MPYDRTSSNNRQPAEIQVDGKRRAKALFSSVVKDLFWSNFPLPGKSAEDAQCTEITWWGSATLELPVLRNVNRPATSCMRARVALVETQAARQAPSSRHSLYHSSNNPNDGTPEEGSGLPGQASIFSFTLHSTISLRTCRCRAVG